MNKPRASNKIVFANQLRGIAVLLVVISHFAGVYWGARDIVSTYTFAPRPEGVTPWLAIHVMPPTVNYGPLGVAIFFLISGFVIPFSLEKMGRARFVVARILRIYPTYWAASCLTVCSIWLSSHYWGRPFAFDPTRFLSSMLLVNNQIGQATVDLVNWTLSIEVKFYVAAALMWSLIKRGSVLALVVFDLALLALVLCFPEQWGSFNVDGVWYTPKLTLSELMFLPFLFIGTMFNMNMKRQISSGKLLAGALISLSVVYAMCERLSPWFNFWGVQIDYCYGLAIFAACFYLRDHFRPLRPLDFLADISYPLYIVHSLTGYVLIRFMMAHGAGYAAAVTAAFAIVVVLAYGVHRLIEVPTSFMGKRLHMKVRDPVARAPEVTRVEHAASGR